MASDDVIYHYCSTQTFHSIVTSKTIRLSALSYSNDRDEGSVLFNICRRRMLKDGMPEKLVDDVVGIIRTLRDNSVMLGFCCSIRDRLSQWRGYADDGRGLAIGFSKSGLQSLADSAPKTGKYSRPLRLQAIEYVDDISITSEMDGPEDFLLKQQLFFIMELFKSGDLQKIIDISYPSNALKRIDKSDPRVEKFRSAMFFLYWQAFIYKSTAFKEEEEVRLMREVDYVQYRPNTALLDDPFDHLPDCKYHPKSTRLVPYHEFRFDPKVVYEFILGPQHETPKPIVEAFVRGAKFTDAKVSTSVASYRSA